MVWLQLLDLLGNIWKTYEYLHVRLFVWMYRRPEETRGPKGHISCTWVQCATFVATSWFSDRPENTSFVEDIEILLSINFPQIAGSPKAQHRTCWQTFSLWRHNQMARQIVAQLWRHSRMTSKSHMESHMSWKWRKVNSIQRFQSSSLCWQHVINSM